VVKIFSMLFNEKTNRIRFCLQMRRKAFTCGARSSRRRDGQPTLRKHPVKKHAAASLSCSAPHGSNRYDFVHFLILMFL